MASILLSRKVMKLKNPLCWNLYRNHRHLLLLLAILLVMSSIIALNYLCPDELCGKSSFWFDSSSSSSSSLSSAAALSQYPYPEPNDNPKRLDTKFDVDRILLKRFGYDYDHYRRFRMKQYSNQVNLYNMLSNVGGGGGEGVGKNNNGSSSGFNMKGNDVMVFLHMQKTGGSAFDRHLVRDLILEQPCKCDVKRKKKCRCFRPGTNNKYWLFSRYSIGWRCGLHADHTELINCVDRVLNQAESGSPPPHNKTKQQIISDNFVSSENDNAEDDDTPERRYFYVTILRDPIARFVSEFKHVQRGATWKTSRHWCNGRLPTPHELQACFRGPNWRNVTLQQFIDCRHNLAFNRQTRMLADLTLVGCYNRTFMSTAEIDTVMLFSAKENLRRMAFFGLCEEQLASQYLFERTFDLHFRRSFVQFNQTRSYSTLASISPGTMEQIRKLNHLDLKLYSFAQELFRDRFSIVRNMDSKFEQNFAQLVQRSRSQKQPIQPHFKNLQPQSQQQQKQPNKSRRIESVSLNSGNGNKQLKEMETNSNELNDGNAENYEDDYTSDSSNDATDDSIEYYYSSDNRKDQEDIEDNSKQAKSKIQDDED